MSLKSCNKVDTNVTELEIQVSAEDFRAAVIKVFNRRKKSITIPGFRKGKAPLNLVEKAYGKDVFYDDAIELLFPDLIADAYEKGGIKAVDNPYDFDLKSVGDDGLHFSVKVVTMPEIELALYKGIQAEKPDTEVGESEVDAEVERLRERNARILTADDRAAKTDDITVIDFEGFVDGVAFEGGKAENYSLTLGSGSFIPGFEDQIIGHKAGEDFDVNVTFPEEYTPELAGKAAVFKVKLHEIKYKELPEADDEFAKDVGDYETVAEMRKGIAEEIGDRKKQDAERVFEEQVLGALVDHVMGEIPEVMFEKRAKENTDDFSHRLSHQGADLDSYLMYTGLDRDTFDAQMLETARRQVTLSLALDKVAALENLMAEESDFEEEYKNMAETYKLEVEKIKEIIAEETVKGDVLRKKAADFVLANAVNTAQAPKAPAKKKAAKTEDKEKTEKKTAKKAATEKEETPAEKKKAPATKKTAAAEKEPAAEKKTAKTKKDTPAKEE